ncbi:MAG: DUF202 domain-containing protein [Pseudonocardiaceae bacterium]|nr:DUF202 domain-containing protein [Pseudonocardiaceae bacterium]
MTDSPLLDATTAAERTSLAWQRTGLAMVVTGALLVHTQVGAGALRPLSGVVLVAAGVVAAALVAPLRYRTVLRRVDAQRSPLGGAAVVGACLVVCAATVTTAITLLVG